MTGMIFLTFILFPSVYSFSLYNDLVPLYENSQEVNESKERPWLFMEQIQGLASYLIRNVSNICPLNQSAYFERVEKIVLNTLAEIYENEETLMKNIFYENLIPPVKSNLEKCLNNSKSKISLDEYYKREYPETLLHIDLEHRSDITKWQDFRPCIRTQIKSNLYHGTIPSIIDTIWQSFLLGYLGCSDYWESVREWSFLDLVQQIIIQPLFQRWSSKFLMNIGSVPTNEKNSSSSTISSEIIDVLSQNGHDDNSGDQMSLETISSWFEKCNVILFLRHKIDPIPCFRDVIFRHG